VHRARENILEDQLKKTFSVMLDNYCTKKMQNAIKEHPDFDSKIQDDPIELLKAIRTLAHNPVRATYPIITDTNTIVNLLGAKQRDEEVLFDWIAEFKAVEAVYKQNFGCKILDDFVEKTEEYKSATDKDAYKKEAYNRWIAYLFLRGCDQKKYGSLLTGLRSQFSLNNKQYPVDLAAAIDAVQGHKWDETYKKGKDKSKNDKDKNNSNSEDKQPNPPATSFAQQGKDITCHCCGKKGHIAPKCKEKDKIPRDKWWINRAVQHYQAAGNTNEDDVSDYETEDDQSVQSQQTTRSTRSNSSSSTNARRSGSRGIFSNFSGVQLLSSSKSVQVISICLRFLLSTLDQQPLLCGRDICSPS